MGKVIDVPLPDIGDFENVDVIEVLVAPGDRVEKEDSLITLESDKATMEVPSPEAGTINDVKVKVGDKVSKGDIIIALAVEEAAAGEAKAEAEREGTREAPSEGAPERPDSGREEVTGPAPRSEADLHAEVLVLGSGPGGYTAAFRAADLGKNVVLVERHGTLGGVCLNVGCIPSKALLHVAEVIDQAESLREHGVEFGEPRLDRDKLRRWKDKVVGQLTSGLSGLAKKRKVKVVQGVGRFVSKHEIEVEGKEGPRRISFDHAIIAVGSRSIELPDIPSDDPRVLDSTSALELQRTDGDLLVIGGGIIGLEMATVYDALGSRVTVAELSPALMPGADPDLVRVLQKRIQARYEGIYVNTRVARVEAERDGLVAHFEGGKAPDSQRFDQVLVAVGRRPNSDRIGLEDTGVAVDDGGFIKVDEQQRTSAPHIFAIGDVVGQPLLAHKATHEGKIAAEVIAGLKSAFDARTIPSVAYTDPEVAWAGVTEFEAKERKLNYGKGMFPWAASGRSLSLGRDEGMTKIIFDKDNDRILGMGIVGPQAGELISEGVLAIEMGADAADIGLSIHPHPTLSETVAMAAEAYEGTITDLYLPKR